MGEKFAKHAPLLATRPKTTSARFIHPTLLRNDPLPSVYELKLDGWRAAAFMRNREVHLRARNDNEFNAVTMRMGTSADDSVLDRNAEARWVRRLFVVDNSALANGIGGPNPTLTTQALATRTAESTFTRYFGGDPWSSGSHRCRRSTMRSRER